MSRRLIKSSTDSANQSWPAVVSRKSSSGIGLRSADMVGSKVAGVDPTKLGCTHPFRWLPLGAEGSACGLGRGGCPGPLLATAWVCCVSGVARCPLLIAGLAGRLRCGLRASYSQRQTASVRDGSQVLTTCTLQL